MSPKLSDALVSFAHPIWFLRSSVWRLAIKKGWIKTYHDTMDDQKRDMCATFDESPPCALCQSNTISEVMITADGCHIVQCKECGLWFTSPRINEKIWMEYLKTDTERNIDFTNNRINYGVALSGNIKYVPPYWRNQIYRVNEKILNEIETHIPAKEKLHDVGCGVGFLMQDAKKHGWKNVSGNELNSYACNVMNEKLGLKVYNDILPNLAIPNESLDAITMTDYIEHTFQPLMDIQKAYDILRNHGVLYIETFHLNCRDFKTYQENWNMLFWNHVYHFTKKTLETMIKLAGFKIIDTRVSFDNPLINIIAQKN